MRISDNTIVRNYMTSLSKNSSLRNKEGLKVSTGRRFQTAAEDPVAAMKAMGVRRSMSRIEDYQNNIRDLDAYTDEREAAVSEMSSILTEISSLLMQGKTGTYSASDRESISASLRGYQETLLDIANSSYCGKYIFGGAQEYDIPFTVDAHGNFCYQSQDVNTSVFMTERVDLDISAGTKVNRAVTGATLMGFGVDADGLSNNIYNFVGQLATAFQTNNLSGAEKFASKLTAIQGDLTVKYAEIGAQSEFMKLFSDRLIASKTNLTERQTGLEGVDHAEAIMTYKEMSAAFDATLAMGAKIIPQTLLDYISR